MIMADEQRIMQILLNLQSNALKFTEKGKIEIIVKIITENEDKFLEVKVVDSGIGIKEEDQHKLFKLFGFVQDARQMNTNGIGLGLVICDQLVTQFGGKMAFESHYNLGSTFGFTIKL